MSEEEDFDVSEQEVAHMLELMKKMKLKPKLDSEQDFISWMEGTVVEHKGIKTEEESEPKGAEGGAKPKIMKQAPSYSFPAPPITHAPMNYPFSFHQPTPVPTPLVPASVLHFPKLTQFSGESGSKAGSTAYDIWKQEVMCLQSEGHSEATIRQAIRTSLKGKALQLRAKAGPNATVKEILDKMESIYGIVQPKEILLKKFYNATQDSNEDVASWGCRIQQLYDDAVNKDALTLEDDETLRTIFWSGLAQPLKDVTGHLYEKYNTFDELLRAVRRSEQERPQSKPDKSATVKSASVSNKEHDDLKESVKKLEATIQSLVNWQKEQQHQSRQPPQPQQQFYNRRDYRNTPNRGQGRFQTHGYGRGRGAYGRRTQAGSEVLGFPDSQEFSQQQHETRTCYVCGQVGHLQYDCPARTHGSQSVHFPLNANRPYGRGRR